MFDEIIGYFKKEFGPKPEKELTAEMAWYETKHGEGTFVSLEERIKDKQQQIRSTIKDKFTPRAGTTNHYFNQSAFHCVIDIEEDLVDSVEEIFQPFIDGGFTVVDLSKECKSVSVNDSVYLISWVNAYNKKKHE